MIKIATHNRKGGVGKTTTCHHLAGALAEAGYRTLLVDLDPQANLSARALPGSDFLGLDRTETVAEVYLGGRRPVESLRRPVWDRVDILPGSSLLEELDPEKPWDRPMGEQSRLAEALADAGPLGYDFALIDCPPSLRMLTWSALVAADYLLLPIQPEDYGAMGATAALDLASRASEANPLLKLLGLVVTMRDRRQALHAIHEEEIRSQHGADVFDAVIPRLAAYHSAITGRQPVTRYDRTGPAAEAIRSLRDELLSRVGSGKARAIAPAPAAAGKGVA